MKTTKQLHAELDKANNFVKKIENKMEKNSPKADFKRINELSISIIKD